MSMERPASRSSMNFSQGGTGKPPDRPPSSSVRSSAAMNNTMQSTLQSTTGSSIMGSIAGSMGPPGTASGKPPQTSMRGGGQPVVPGTAYKRTGTASGRPGTGQQQAAVVGRAAPVPVENRPITQHGVSGVRGAVASAGRQVLDKTYFLNELRQKRTEIINVTTAMKEELEALEKRQAQFNTMDKRASDLTKEVKLLQEALADYNCVLSKVGTQTPVYQITQEVAQLKERNDVQRKRVDEILTERLSLESKIKQAEQDISKVQQSIDSRLNSMPPSQRQQYMDLLSEQQSLAAEAKKFDEIIDELDKQLGAQEGELARNPLKQRSLQLQEQIRTLTEKKYEVQQEEEKAKQSPEEQREAILTRVKRDQADCEAANVAVKELTDAMKKMEARINSMGGGAVSAVEDKSRREKFDELVAKERDLNNFLDSFPSRKAAKLSERQSKEDNILTLLDRIAKLQSMSSSALPSQKKFKEMQDELEYKQMQLENTQSTQERLKEELTMRRSELEKIDTLDERIKTELTSLDEKSEQMRKQMTDFENIGELKTRAEANKVRLENLRTSLAVRKDLLKVMVAEKSLKYQAKRAQLQENNLQIQLEKMESKLRSVCSSNFQMSDFIKTKESETNYRGMVSNITGMVNELNTYLKKSMM